jgi:hypothetical protein
MIAGLTKMAEAAPLVRYRLRAKSGSGEWRGYILGGTLVVGGEEDLIAHFDWLCRLRPDVRNPIEHGWISLAPGEWADPSRELEMAATFAETKGWGAYVVVKHQDSANSHFHMIGTRVHPDGRVSREHLREFRRIEKILRSMEIQYGYRRVESPRRPRSVHGRSEGPKATNREKKVAQRGKATRKQALREELQAVLAAGFRKGGVLLEMNRRGWEPNTTWRDGHPIGVCWREVSTGFTIPASRLGVKELSGKRFFALIGGLDGEYTGGSRIVDPERIKPFDFDRHWQGVLRKLDPRYRPVASRRVSGEEAHRTGG